jgi:hypothetical protein
VIEARTLIGLEESLSPAAPVACYFFALQRCSEGEQKKVEESDGLIVDD